jgi:phosphate:Na+ symporter
VFAPLTIAGGVALILFGVGFLRRGLDRLFGERLGPLMQSLAVTRMRAFGTGLGVALVAPSSTTVSMLAIQTVQAGRLSPRQTLAVMFGADIGLTMTVQLLALQIEQWAPLLILIGVTLFQYTSGSRSRGAGQSLLALGFIFLGISIIKTGAGTIRPGGDMVALIELAKDHPMVIALLGALTALGLQSSTATIAVVIGLAGGGAIDISLSTAIAWVVGANLGIVLTTLMLGFRQIDSRRLALGNLLAKLGIAAIFMTLLPHIADWTRALPGSYGNHVAHAHTGFNVLLALLCLPLTEWIALVIEKMTPVSLASGKTFGPRYIDVHGRIESVTLALGQSRQEILHMSELVQTMLIDLWRGMQRNDEHMVRRVSRRDDEVDILDEQIKRFLTRVISVTRNDEDAAEQMRQLRYASELETIGDITDKNLCEVVLKKIASDAEFSTEGNAELDEFFRQVIGNMRIAQTAFVTRDTQLARQLLRNKERVDDFNRELRDRHFARLNAGLAASHETSAIHLDLLTHLRRINSAVTHVAFAILHTTADGAAKPE